MHIHRQFTSAACSALALALLSAGPQSVVQADEAAELLGQRTLEPAVRTVIDDTDTKDQLKHWHAMAEGDEGGAASAAMAPSWQIRMANPAGAASNSPAINQWLNPAPQASNSQPAIALKLQGIDTPDFAVPGMTAPSDRHLNRKMAEINSTDLARISPAITHWLNPTPAVAGVSEAIAQRLPGVLLLGVTTPDVNAPDTSNLATQLPEVKIPGLHVLDVVKDANARVDDATLSPPRLPDQPDSKDTVPQLPDVRVPQTEDPRQVQMDKILDINDTRLNDAMENIAALTQSIVTRNVDLAGAVDVHVQQINAATQTFSSDLAQAVNARVTKTIDPNAQVEGRVKQGLAGASQAIDGALDKVKNVLDAVNQKVASAVGGGLDRVKVALIEKADTNAQDLKLARAEKSTHDAQHPAYDDYCVAHCSKWDPHKKVEAETPDSLRNRVKWDAENEKIQAKIDTADKQEKQFRAASAQTDMQKAQLLSELTAAVAAAKDKMNVPDFSTPIQAGVDTSADPGAGDEAHTKTAKVVNLLQQTDGAPLETRLSLGRVSNQVTALGVVNVAIGLRANAQQQLASVGGGAGIKTFLDLDDQVVLDGALNGAIGADSRASQTLSSVGTVDKNQTFGGNIKLTSRITGAVNVAIGNSSSAIQRLASLGGSAGGGVTMVNTVTGMVGAAVGNDTSTLIEIGNLDGTVGQTANFSNILAISPIAAALGNSAAATVRAGVLAANASVTGPLTMAADLTLGAVAAAIGDNSTSVIEAGVLQGHVGGAATVNLIAGNTIAVSIGYDTTATSRSAVLGSQGSVSGNLNMSVATGELVTFALGAHTKATTMIGVVDAPVQGNVKINVNTGEVLTGTVGVNTEATTVIGSVTEPHTGDIDISVNMGAVNTMAIGLSTSDTIYAKSYIGNVMSQSSGAANTSVTMGSKTNLGLGLIIDFGALGTLRLVEQGCVKVGNLYVQSPC